MDKRDQLLNIMEDAAKGETKAALRKEIAALKAENERLTKEWEAAGLAAKQRQDEIDKLRALAERAGGVKVLQAELDWYSKTEHGALDGIPYPHVAHVIRVMLSRLTTETAAPEERQEVKPVGYLFRLRYGPDRWSHQDMFSDCLPDNPDDVKDVRPLYTHPAPTHNDGSGAVTDGELQNYIHRCRELSENGQYSWWIRLADILSSVSHTGGEVTEADTSSMRDCATDGCDKKASVRFERGGVGSEYCHNCYTRVQALREDAS